jgi:hypothetical protein
MITPDTPAGTPAESQTQYIQRLAADINNYNQIAFFCGMATAGTAMPSVQLILGNQHRTTIYLNVATLLPALSAEGKRLQESLQMRDIDTDELLQEVGNSLSILTKQKGG